MKRKILSLLLCLAILAGMLPVLVSTPIHAATASQNNIVARADYMYNLTWTCQSDVYGWNYETLFTAGNTYRVPYGQPIYSGYYIGYGVEIDTFLTAANTPGSIYYTSRSTYNDWSSVYYATDCSAFVSWCWGIERCTTYSLPFKSTDLGMANATNVYNLQLGDALNSNSVGHVVLVTGLTYDATGSLTQVEITEQTPPQLKRSYYTPAELAAKYGSAYSILRYSGDVPAAPEGSGGSTGYDRGYAGGMAGSGEYKAFGLDVSAWQGEDLDFNNIKSAGYDYVILRAGTTYGKDSCFETYYTNAKAAGLDVGAYYFSYALDTASASSDAEAMLSYISGKQFEYPIYFDYETEEQHALDPSVSRDIILTFLDQMADEGYLVGLYTGKYFSSILPIDTICAKYEIWMAHYLQTGDGTYDGTNDYEVYGPTYSSMYGMFQFTDSTWINGQGPYDGDVCFKDYPSIVKAYGFNGYEYVPSYADECTSYPAHCQIEVTLEGAPVNSQPCSVSSDRNSFTLESAALGDTYIANGLFLNEYGNYWYRIATDSGITGYIYGGEAKYLGDVTTDIKVSNYDTPNGHVAGSIFYVTGTVTSQYNQLANASVWVRKGFGTAGTQVTGYTAAASSNTYTLKGSDIDNKTAFDAVGTGEHTYVISAGYTSYYADGATTLKTSTGTKDLAVEYFMVIPSAADQTSCVHSCTTTVIGSASCTEEGLEISACSKCGLVNEAAIPATDHAFSDWSTAVSATCTTNGTEVRICATCGHQESQTVAASGHTYNMIRFDATCTQYPYDEYTCGNCGHSYKVFLGESSPWSDTKPQGIPDELIETKSQYRYSDYETATSYDSVLDGYTMIGSDWDSGTAGTVNYVATWPSGFNTAHSTYATYNQQGNKVTAAETENLKVTVNSDAVVGYLWYHWCASGYTTSVANKTSVYSNFHAFYSTTSPAQADKHDTSDNSYKLSASTACSDCLWYWAIPVYAQNYTTQQKIYTHGRWGAYSQWSDEAVTASDTRQVEQKTVYRYIMADLGEHIWNAGEVTVAPGCATEGTKTYTCIDCGESYTETVSATGHSYTSTVTAPTCTEAGFTTYTCACGDSYIADEAAATGHSYTAAVTAPTCTEAGFTTYTCACGDSYAADEVAATGHSFVEGKCETCGEADPDYKAPSAVTVKANYPGLAFMDEIYYNVYFTVNNPNSEEIVEMGLITWTSPVDGDVTNAEYVCPGAVLEGNYWKTRSQAIAAKNMGEELYFKAYAKLADGTYIYSVMRNYSAKSYCESKLSTSSDTALKAMCVALMNYGAAAQEYFGYKTDELMNAGLTEERKALAAPYSDNMIPALVSVGTKGDGLKNNGGYTQRYPSVTFGGALAINYNFKPANTPENGMKLYVWTEADVASVDALTLENASQVVEMTDNNGLYMGQVSGIAAKNAGDTYFVCGVYESGGVTYYTGVLAYSVAAYCKSYANNSASAAQPLASTAAIYTYYADAYLNK